MVCAIYVPAAHENPRYAMTSDLSAAPAQPDDTKGAKSMGGILVRTDKDGQRRYTARVRIKGHPDVNKTFPNRSLAMAWKKKRGWRKVGDLTPRQDQDTAVRASD